MPERAVKYNNVSGGPRPWTSGPEEILQHSLDLLQEDTDKSRRLAMLSIDNAVELIIKTYLGLPKRAYGLQIKRSEYQDFSESFPRLLDALERYAPGHLIIGIDLADIEYYHRLRNQLYHHGNGLTVEREKVQVYGELARILFRALFGYDVSPSARPDRDAAASFLSQWAAIESAVVTLLNRKGLRLKLERTLESERRHKMVAGGGTMLSALGAAGLISQEQSFTNCLNCVRCATV
jgi:hypothetical protein